MCKVHVCARVCVCVCVCVCVRVCVPFVEQIGNWWGVGKRSEFGCSSVGEVDVAPDGLVVFHSSALHRHQGLWDWGLG